ncbi:489_t:CDS:2 [Acaulospora colombiana]|uniref:489_t:CDS:1 n=1 Tax=Acaulospora colombiana TaxID=27376 RepID=A0ACA9L7A3_9GLOM|nr:489_t:CDS:2 [Acaulospora colombiana]
MCKTTTPLVYGIVIPPQQWTAISSQQWIAILPQQWTAIPTHSVNIKIILITSILNPHTIIA